MKLEEFEEKISIVLKMIEESNTDENLSYSCNAVAEVFDTPNYCLGISYPHYKVKKSYSKMFMSGADFSDAWLDRMDLPTWIPTLSQKSMRLSMILLFEQYCISEELYKEF